MLAFGFIWFVENFNAWMIKVKIAVILLFMSTNILGKHREIGVCSYTGQKSLLRNLRKVGHLE